MSEPDNDRPPRFGLRRLLGATLIWAARGLVLVGAFTLAIVAVAGLFFPILLAPVVPLLARPLTNLNRRWAGRILGVTIPRPYLPTGDGNWRARLTAIVRDPAYWRDLAWIMAATTVGVAMCAASLLLLLGGIGALVWAALSLPFPQAVEVFDPVATALHVPAGVALVLLGAVLLVAWRLITPGLLREDARMARVLLAPTEQSRLAIRVRDLAESRAQAVDTQAAELRRIERDLHDGAQARLVALGMSLGLAEELVERDPAAAKELLAEAKLTSGHALAELRSVVRGIHPPVLADRGLDGAVQAFALGLPLPVLVEVQVPKRLPPPVESAAYFVVAETLTNVVKHAAATSATVRARHADRFLTIVIQDDGVGGADPARGTGLRGMQRRLAAFDGTLTVTSPQGGPTRVTMELPCELSSPKTSLSSETA